AGRGKKNGAGRPKRGVTELATDCPDRGPEPGDRGAGPTCRNCAQCTWNQQHAGSPSGVTTVGTFGSLRPSPGRGPSAAPAIPAGHAFGSLRPSPGRAPPPSHHHSGNRT